MLGKKTSSTRKFDSTTSFVFPTHDLKRSESRRLFAKVSSSSSRIYPGILAREFSRGNYFSFSATVHQIDLPQSGRVTYRTRQYPVGILILSYYLISSVTRTNAVPGRPFPACFPATNWPWYIPSMFLLPFIVVNLYPVGLGAAGRMCSIEESRANAVSFALLVGSFLRIAEWNMAENRPLMYANRELVWIVEQSNEELRPLYILDK